MEKEYLACIDDKNIKYLQLGQISKYIFPMERKEAHLRNQTHLIIRFFIVSKDPNNEILYLVQKRGKNKKSFPGYYTDSASGHVIWIKNLDLKQIKQNAIRELEEEFGIPSSKIKKVKFYDLNKEENDHTTEVSYIFFGLVEYRVKLKPNPNELDLKGSRFYNRTELEDLLENEKSVDYSHKIWKKLLNMDLLSLFEEKLEEKAQKEGNIAFFIGRFQPLHHGHIYVLKRILDSFNSVKIGIGSSQLSHLPNDPFTSDERKKFIKAALERRNVANNRYKVYEIPDIFNAKKWVEHVVSIVGEFNTIFSNSDWVRALFLNKDFRVGRKIEIFKKKFNGNNIRTLIREEDNNWRHLVPKEVSELIEDFNGINRIKMLKARSEKD
ncbi:MAG: nicotinamide-nucleotide adenylyltransferase [Promethearchaeota archaeon]